MQTLKLLLKIHNGVCSISYIGGKKCLENRYNDLTVFACFIINECKEYYFKKL